MGVLLADIVLASRTDGAALARTAVPAHAWPFINAKCTSIATFSKPTPISSKTDFEPRSVSDCAVREDKTLFVWTSP